LDKISYDDFNLSGLYEIVKHQKRDSPRTVATEILERFEATEIAKDSSYFGRFGGNWYKINRRLAEVILEVEGERQVNRAGFAGGCLVEVMRP
jgi:hypothetical protein